MAVMKELSLDSKELLDNVQKFVLCGRAMLDAIEEITIQFAQSEKIIVQSSNEPAAEAPSEPAPVKQTETAKTETEAPKTATMEEVRGLLAEKSRSGFRAEVKALLTAHGVEKLSEITDPVELGKLQEEAGKIGATG